MNAEIPPPIAGARFETRYWRRRLAPHSLARRAAILAAAAGAFAVGAFLLVFPGPGLLVIAFGAGLLAEESLAVARLLDRLEARLRSLFRR